MNPNLQFTTTFINSLATAGLRHVCIAPGSRSTPLTLAFEAHSAIELHLHLDERCAAFFGLGLALASDAPVALVCTSGSAAANFFPAIIEAMMSQVPLLILTADRPHELRHSGANQTIDQIKLFGDQVLWSVDAPLPEVDAPPIALRNLHTLAARAYSTANGSRKGPVHINFPFRKPLEPQSKDWPNSPFTIHHSPFTIHHSPLPTASDTQINHLISLVTNHPNGLIVCGPRCPDGSFPEAVAALSRHSGYPILADPTSGVRYGPWVENTAVISTYETLLQTAPAWSEPEVVIRFGALPVSKWLNHYLSEIRPSHRIHIRSNGVWADDSHWVNEFWQVDETAVCLAVSERLGEGAKGEGARGERAKGEGARGEGARGWVQADQGCRRRLAGLLAERAFDGSFVADVLRLIPDGSLLFMGNSLPIRHLDQYGLASPKKIQAYASRGASGIDGNLSTALGLYAGSGKKLVMVVGDITFYHDLNGLFAIKQRLDHKKSKLGQGAVLGQRIDTSSPTDLSHAVLDITIVLINNNGGGIFNRLPVAKFEPPFNKLFITPHNLDFEPAVRMYGLDFVRIDGTVANGRLAFQTAFAQSLNDPTPRVIEIKTDGQADERIRKEINGLVKTAHQNNAK